MNVHRFPNLKSQSFQNRDVCNPITFPNFLWFLLLVFFSGSAWAQNCPPQSYSSTPGFYKDLLIDSGAYLSTGFNSVISSSLGLSTEDIDSWNCDPEDASPSAQCLAEIDDQNFLLVGNPLDTNGILLYPDGEPRFRMVWVMGGQASLHGETLGNIGASRFQDFLDHGGSYAGSCAGAFIADNDNIHYFSIWSGNQQWSGHDLGTSPLMHDAQVESNSPLTSLGYVNGQVFGPLLHAGGGYLYTIPSGTEILLRYTGIPPLDMNGNANPLFSLNGKPLAWAYKDGNESGRLVNIGSHPESGLNQVSIELSQAMITYALDGQGDVQIKTSLQNGTPWCMNLDTGDNEPDHTRIGDRQYHHFEVILEEPTSIQIDLGEESGWNSENFDLDIHVRKDNFAFENAPDLILSDLSPGLTKTVHTPVLAAGTYFIGVTCPNTVERSHSMNSPYCGSTAILNGAAYWIRATWGSELPSPRIENLEKIYCDTDQDVTLIGMPAGGTFQGPGINGNTFSPSQLAPGTYTIHYESDCVTVSEQVEILGTPPAPQNLRLVTQSSSDGKGEGIFSGTSPCLNVGYGYTMMVDDMGPGITYEWEVENSICGYFACEDGNIATFMIDTTCYATRIRVRAKNGSCVGPPSAWLLIP